MICSNSTQVESNYTMHLFFRLVTLFARCSDDSDTLQQQRQHKSISTSPKQCCKAWNMFYTDFDMELLDFDKVVGYIYATARRGRRGWLASLRWYNMLKSKILARKTRKRKRRLWYTLLVFHYTSTWEMCRTAVLMPI